mmetsp:Transcript_24275/g.75088  ORF Transcript_24275/g.75088 Transcript_24275/m.75088 type:complete len:242 (-) Transcript_24275:7-732(-)
MRPSSVWMMSAPWPSYAAAAGAPASASWSAACEAWPACTKAASLAPSAELSAEACTSMVSASVMLPELFSCSIDAPPFCISFVRMLMARSIMSMTSVSSFSSFRKSVFSALRTSVAALRSASSAAMLPDSSSIFVVIEPMSEVALLIAASSSLTCFFPVLISYPTSLFRSSQNSANSSYTFCATSPSAMILACWSESNWMILSIGLVSAADVAASAKVHSIRAMAFIARAGRGDGTCSLTA